MSSNLLKDIKGKVPKMSAALSADSTLNRAFISGTFSSGLKYFQKAFRQMALCVGYDTTFFNGGSDILTLMVFLSLKDFNKLI